MSPQLSRESYTRFSLVYIAYDVCTYKSQKKLGTAHTHTQSTLSHYSCLGGLFSFNIPCLWLMTGWTETEMSSGLMRARAAVYHLCPIICIKYIIYIICIDAVTRESLAVEYSLITREINLVGVMTRSRANNKTSKCIAARIVRYDII